MPCHNRVRMQPYVRVQGFSHKLKEFADDPHGPGSFHPGYTVQPKFMKYGLRDGVKEGNLKYKPGRTTLVKPALTNSQKERFCKLLHEAYGLEGEYLSSGYRDISHFIKKRFAENEKAFFVRNLPTDNGVPRKGLFVRHINPDGSPGGVYEATIHFHGSESRLIIMPDCTISGSPALSGFIKLYHGSMITGRGRYEDCMLVRGTKLYSCEANAAFFSDSFGSKTLFGKPDGKEIKIISSGFKNCGIVAGNRMKGMWVDGRYTGSYAKAKAKVEAEKKNAREPASCTGNQASGTLQAEA